MSSFRRLFGAALLVCLGACSDSVPTSPAAPSLPVPQSYVVSGTVSETVDGISRPAVGRKVDLYISPLPCLPATRCLEQAPVVETDQNGRYTAQMTAYPQTRVFVAGAGLHALGRQPRLATALVDKDTVDVEVFPVDSSSTPPPAAGPMITGFVFAMTPQGRNPLRGVWASLTVGFVDSYLVAKTQTDDAGRFFFCRVNAPVTMFVDRYEIPVPGTGDMHFELEVNR